MVNIPFPISLAQLPTPIECLHRLSAHLGGPRIWVKRDDLTGSVLSGNKLRKLEFSMSEATEQGAKVIITIGGVQSNHCRATALVCAKLGLKCHLLLRGSKPDAAPDGNLLMDILAGANITFLEDEGVSSHEDYLKKLMDDYAKQGLPPYFIPLGASNAVGSLGYMSAWDEIMNQQEMMQRQFSHLFCAVGSGGTLSGLIAGKAISNSENAPEIYGINVCNDAQYFTTEIRNDLNELNEKYGLGCTEEATTINIIDGFVGPGYAIAYPQIIETIQLAAKLEGLILDPVYTGKAFYGMMKSIEQGLCKKNDDVLFLHTGGMFGLFPQRDEFTL